MDKTDKINKIKVKLQDDRVIWTYRGKFHRGGDLPAIIHADGYKEWWVNGKRKRSNYQNGIKII